MYDDPERVIEHALAGRAVCSEHLDEPYLRRWVDENAQHTSCSYCDRRGAGQPLAAPADEVAKLVLQGLLRGWNSYEDELGSWGMGYDGQRTTAELLDEHQVTSDEELAQTLVQVLPDHGWVQRDFFRLTPHDRFSEAWIALKEAVKHRSRFFFVLRRPDPRDPDDLSPLKILETVGDGLDGAGLIKTWDAGTVVYRGRPHSRAEGYSDAWDLAAVPRSKASRAAANRMSAAGVALFYGARERDVAVAETTSASADRVECVTVGKFELARPMTILDLTAELEIPSVFDRDRGDHHGTIAFLRDFVRELSIPVARDGREHVEYVPTQVVCEYFRSLYGHESNPPRHVDGIAYRSAQAKGATSVVLFVENLCVANADGARPPRPDDLRWFGGAYEPPRSELTLVGVERIESPPMSRCLSSPLATIWRLLPFAGRRF